MGFEPSLFLTKNHHTHPSHPRIIFSLSISQPNVIRWKLKNFDMNLCDMLCGTTWHVMWHDVMYDMARPHVAWHDMRHDMTFGMVCHMKPIFVSNKKLVKPIFSWAELVIYFHLIFFSFLCHYRTDAFTMHLRALACFYICVHTWTRTCVDSLNCMLGCGILRGHGCILGSPL